MHDRLTAFLMTSFLALPVCVVHGDSGKPSGPGPRPSGGSRASLEFYVAPTGADENPGTREKPFASLIRARRALRALKRQGSLPAGGVTVNLRGGR